MIHDKEDFVNHIREQLKIVKSVSLNANNI